MPESDIWLSVVAKSLAFMCLRQAQHDDPERFDSVLAKVKFLENLGLSEESAAGAAGSTAASVAVLRRRIANKKKRTSKRNGASKKKR